jgi:Mo-co oxidoreductase dimerisation domain
LPTGPTKVSGAAWAGRDGISTIEVRLAGGQWQQAVVNIPSQPTALHRWSARLELPPGDHRIEVRARDGSGAYQPKQAEWNPLGYANNSIHGVRIHVLGAS